MFTNEEIGNLLVTHQPNRELTKLEAITYCMITGESLTVQRYSSASQQEVQFYVYKDKFYVQGKHDKPEEVSYNSYEDDKFIAYEGKYDIYFNTMNAKKDEYEQLKVELEPWYTKVKRLEQLEKELKNAKF